STGRQRRGREPRHEPHADTNDGAGWPVRLPAASARTIQGHLDAPRVQHARAGEYRADSRRVVEPVIPSVGVEYRPNDHGEPHADRPNDAVGGGEYARPNDR